MTIAPIAGAATVDAGNETVRPLAHDHSSLAAFEKALSAQAGQAFAGANLAPGSIMELASASEAADNAWVSVMTVLEKLQGPNLEPGKAKALLEQLSTSYRHFQVQSLPIARLVQGVYGSGK